MTDEELASAIYLALHSQSPDNYVGEIEESGDRVEAVLDGRFDLLAVARNIRESLGGEIGRT